MSASDPKGGESRCAYPRDVYPHRRIIETVAEHEAALRRVENDRWRRRLLACLPVVSPLETDFPGCVE